VTGLSTRPHDTEPENQSLQGSQDLQGLRVSFEFFPPKNAKMEDMLWQSVRRLEPYGPQFCSVTYGAGGSTRERTHATLARMLNETSLTPAAHLTCVSATRAEVDDVIRAYYAIGVRHVVALRGDPPEGAGSIYKPHPNGYDSSAELVRGVKAIGDFEVSVSAYPEKHPESPDIDADFDMLQRKVDAGADRAITQFFFDNAHFFRYLERVRARGIDVPITPGIVAIHNFKQVAGFAAKCGASVPAWVAQRFEGLEDGGTTAHMVAAALAAEQVSQLAEAGIREFHFYTMNRADLVVAICRTLGLKPMLSDHPEALREEASL
jgi:methylenetetrahydrofolate reductase (NADPH)